MKIPVLVLSSTLQLAACVTQPDSLALVADYQHHKNNQDLESTLSMFAEDAKLNFGPLGSLAGAANIRGIHEYDLALDTIVLFEDCQAKEKGVSCRATETNRWLDLADIAFITYSESLFVLDSNRQIESISATLSPGSIEVLGAAMADFDAWARTNRDAEYAVLFSPDGAFTYSYENGEKVLELLRQWRAR